MTKIRIHPTVILMLLFPAIKLLTWVQMGILWLCAILHEAGHVAGYRLCGSKMESITLLPFGLCAVPDDPLRITPGNEVFCAAAGPTVNLLLSLFCLALPIPSENVTMRYFLYCNLSLFAVNVLPILPLDGGRMVYYALAGKLNARICETVCCGSAVLLLCLLLIPVVTALIVDRNPSLAMIWGYLATYTALRRGSI